MCTDSGHILAAQRRKSQARGRGRRRPPSDAGSAAKGQEKGADTQGGSTSTRATRRRAEGTPARAGNPEEGCWCGKADAGWGTLTRRAPDEVPNTIQDSQESPHLTRARAAPAPARAVTRIIRAKRKQTKGRTRMGAATRSAPGHGSDHSKAEKQVRRPPRFFVGCTAPTRCSRRQGPCALRMVPVLVVI